MKIPYLTLLILIFASCVEKQKENEEKAEATVENSTTTVLGKNRTGQIPDDAKTIEINANSTGFVNVRSSNDNFSQEFTGNILCQIPCGSTLHAVGPIKNKESGAGLCYRVYLKDSTGRICNGFIAYSCVK